MDSNNNSNNKYKRYNIEKVKKIYYEHFGLYVIKDDLGYKGYRHKRFVTYTVKDEFDNVRMSHVTLSALGDYLAQEDLY